MSQRSLVYTIKNEYVCASNKESKEASLENLLKEVIKKIVELDQQGGQEDQDQDEIEAIKYMLENRNDRNNNLLREMLRPNYKQARQADRTSEITTG